MDDLKIKYSLEKISETDEEILYRLSWIILGEHHEHWFTEKKEEHSE